MHTTLENVIEIPTTGEKQSMWKRTCVLNIFHIDFFFGNLKNYFKVSDNIVLSPNCFFVFKYAEINCVAPDNATYNQKYFKHWNWNILRHKSTTYHINIQDASSGNLIAVPQTDILCHSWIIIRPQLPEHVCRNASFDFRSWLAFIVYRPGRGTRCKSESELVLYTNTHKPASDNRRRFKTGVVLTRKDWKHSPVYLRLTHLFKHDFRRRAHPLPSGSTLGVPEGTERSQLQPVCTVNQTACRFLGLAVKFETL